ICVVPALVFRDALLSRVVHGVTTTSLTFAIAAVPFMFLTAFAMAFLLGRQAIGLANGLALGQAIGALVLLIGVVGFAGLGVDGAVATYLAVAAGVTFASVFLVLRVAPFRHASLEPLLPLL